MKKVMVGLTVYQDGKLVNTLHEDRAESIADAWFFDWRSYEKDRSETIRVGIGHVLDFKFEVK